MGMRYSDGTMHSGYTAGRGTTALGIIGTSLGGLAVASMANGGCGGNSGCNNGGLLGGLFGGNNNCYETKEAACLRQENATLRSERYADQVGLSLYNEQVQSDKEIIAYVNAQLERLDNKVNANDNKAFTAIFANAKDIAENDKQTALNKKDSEYQFIINQRDIVAGDEKVKCFVESNYVPGELKMPLTSICPEAMPKCPDVQLVDIINNSVQAALVSKAK